MKNPNFENFKNMTREEKIETLFKDPRKQDSASKETRLEEISHPGLKHELLHVGDGFLETKKEAPKEETPKEKFLWDGLSIKKPEEPKRFKRRRNDMGIGCYEKVKTKKTAFP